MRILIYSWPFAPWIGGLEHLTEASARLYTEAGHEVVVMTATPDPERRAGPFPFAVHRDVGGSELIRLARWADIIQMSTFKASLWATASLLRRPILWQHIDYDTVSPRGICFATGRACRGRFSACYRCLRRDHGVRASFRALASLWLKRLAAPTVAANAVSTEYAQRQMRLPRPCMLPFGVDTARFTGPQRLPPPPLRVFFYGRHIPAKGVDVLVRALRLCVDCGADVVARIAGSGPQRAATEGLARELRLGERAVFLGFVPEDRIVAELQSAHVLVVPSVQDEIGLLVDLEGMSAGCAVVASDVGAMGEHVRDCGILFAPGDAAALARVLKELCGEPDRVARLGKAARERATRTFDERDMANRNLREMARLAGAT